MPKVARYISIREEVFDSIKSYSSVLGIPISKIVSQLCVSFMKNKDKQKLDHRDIKF